MASICGSPVCAGGKPKLKFTYTGDYVVREDGVVELLTRWRPRGERTPQPGHQFRSRRRRWRLHDHPEKSDR